jgi:hypothetical protein
MHHGNILGNKVETAKLLNIGLTTLYRKIEEYNLNASFWGIRDFALSVAIIMISLLLDFAVLALRYGTPI